MRRKPDFKLDSARSQNEEISCLTCLGMFFVSVGSVFVLMAISRVLSGSGSSLDHMICNGALIGLAIILFLGLLQGVQDKRNLREAQQEWKRICESVEVAIVNRHYNQGGSYEDEYGIPHTVRPRYQLELELTAEQRVLFPNLQSMRVPVRENIYSKLIDRNVVRVYYQPDSPMTFLLEEEIE